MSQQRPTQQCQRPCLVSELANARAQDGVNTQRRAVSGVLGNQVAQLQPQLVLALALQRAERVVIHQLR